MITLEAPTAADIKGFCAALEQSLLAALERHDNVAIRNEGFIEPVLDGPTYGGAPADLMKYTGCRIIIDIGAPARQRLP